MYLEERVLHRFIAGLIPVLLLSGAAGAALHAGDFHLSYDAAAGTIGIAPAAQVGFFGQSGFPNYTSEPGLNSLPGELPAGQAIAFNVIAPVSKWDGTTFNQAADETITISYGPAQIVTSTTGPTAGFSIAASATGEYHVHYGFLLNAPASAGVYLLGMELYFANDLTVSSNPFYFVFSQNANHADHEAALAYVENVIVPEPATAAFLLGAGALLLRRRRRRHGPTKSVSSMRQTAWSSVCLLALTAFVSPLAAATVFVDHHIGLEVHDGRLVTGWYTGRDGHLLGFTPSQVFEQNFGHTGQEGTVDWGTNSGPGTFATPSQIGFNLLGPLHKWDSETFVPAAQETLSVMAGPQQIESGAGFVAGIPTMVRDQSSHPNSPGNWGRHHAHYFLSLNGADVSDGGVYFIKTEWFNTSSESTVELAATSRPVWLVFGLNVSAAELDAAGDYVRTEIVPEPTILSLVALGSWTLLRRRIV